nr:MAG TPA: Protein of unknown function (DUF3755) [Herelleviridae sp.]
MWEKNENFIKIKNISLFFHIWVFSASEKFRYLKIPLKNISLFCRVR